MYLQNLDDNGTFGRIFFVWFVCCLLSFYFLTFAELNAVKNKLLQLDHRPLIASIFVSKNNWTKLTLQSLLEPIKNFSHYFMNSPMPIFQFFFIYNYETHSFCKTMPNTRHDMTLHDTTTWHDMTRHDDTPTQTHFLLFILIKPQ